MTVLIMEDDLTYGYALSKALSAAGRTPVVCRSWQEYLTRLESDENVHSVVLDVRLAPGGPNGIALARMTRFKRPGMKVVVISNDPDLLVGIPEDASGFPKSAPLADIAAAAND